MRKTVIFIADSLDNAHKFQQVLSGLDVDVAAGSSVQFKKRWMTLRYNRERHQGTNVEFPSGRTARPPRPAR